LLVPAALVASVDEDACRTDAASACAVAHPIPWHLADPEPFSARRYVNVDMTFREIVGVHPLPGSLIRQLLLRCAEECLDCAASCVACADVSLSENDQELIRVIRVALDCADACELTGRIAIRQSAPDIRLIRGVVEGCAAACLACAEECDGHAADHEQCRLCAEVCRRCKAACDEFLAH
jgi:hypothetical protein